MPSLVQYSTQYTINQCKILEWPPVAHGQENIDANAAELNHNLEM